MRRKLSSLSPQYSVLSTLLLLFFVSCEREERGFRVEPPASARAQSVPKTELLLGQQPVKTVNEYEQNAFAVAEGARLFQWFNCVGCHANGGGGMGPPLMDDKWIYGSDPAQVFSTIVEGRPNGMPSFRGKVPDHQVWQLVAYVRSMSRQVPKDVAPGRRDDMSVKKPEALTSPQPPKPTGGVPKSAERPK